MTQSLTPQRFVGPVALLICCWIFIHKGQAVEAMSVPHGITIIPAVKCRGDQIDNNRTVVLQLFVDGRYRINADDFREDQIAPVMWKVMESRAERVLRIVADDDVEYGRVVRIIAEVKRAVPQLAVVVLRSGPPEDVLSRWCLPESFRLPIQY